MNETANHPVKTTEKTLRLIETLDTEGGLRLTEPEDRLEMSKSGIHNHLSTLREHRYVVKQGHEYSLGLQFLSVGGHVRSRSPLYRHGRSKIDQLAADTGMLANLATDEDGRAVYLYQSRGNYTVSLDTHVGYRLPLHNIGIGKAILASLPRERVEAIIEEWGLPEATENTITDRETLFEELSAIRERGYATVVRGFTIINDVDALDQQGRTARKAFDGSGPLGPWIETDFDPSEVGMETAINGETRQDSNTRLMLFEVPEVVSYLSRRVTLRPGDVIAFGSPANPGTVEPGDVIEITYDGIGTLQNRVVDASSGAAD
jgi:DNA-binding IclR family transcriptional regulator